ncbi:MAG: T9SS type A sorting domain-containing protein [Bacteroidia bacterium]
MKQIYIVVLIMLLNCVYSTAQTPGTLDVTYGTNGIQSTTLTNLKSDDGISILQLLRQADGKFLAIIQRSDYVDSIGQYDEHHYLYRFTANGQTDPAFGTNGRVDLNFYASNLLLLADGKILLLSNDLDELVIVRLLSNGSVDMNYGFEGKNYTGAYFYASNALVQQSGKILITGTRQGTSANLFLRLEPDGSRDFSFGTDGIKLLSFIQNDRYIIVMKELPDGKLVLGCSMYSGTTYAAIVRLTADVNYDLTFSGDGEQQLTYSGFQLSDFEVMGDNRIVVGGHYYFSNFARAGLVFSRLKANGTPDSTFGVNSSRTHNFGGLFDELKSIKVQPDGKIIGVGSSDGRFGVIRLTTTGTTDATFNSTGKTVTPFAGSTSAGIVHLSMEPSGKLLVAGSAFYPDSMMRFTMARYHTGYNVSVDELNTIKHVAVYPNPVADICEVEYTLQQAGEVTIGLYNLQGKLLQSEVAGKEQAAGTYHHQLQLAHLPQGIYVLRISDANGQGTIKLVKE